LRPLAVTTLLAADSGSRRRRIWRWRRGTRTFCEPSRRSAKPPGRRGRWMTRPPTWSSLRRPPRSAPRVRCTATSDGRTATRIGSSL